MKMREALWTAEAAATALLSLPLHLDRMNRGRKAVAAATAVQGAFGTAVFMAKAEATEKGSSSVTRPIKCPRRQASPVFVLCEPLRLYGEEFHPSLPFLTSSPPLDL